MITNRLLNLTKILTVSILAIFPIPYSQFPTSHLHLSKALWSMDYQSIQATIIHSILRDHMAACWGVKKAVDGPKTLFYPIAWSGSRLIAVGDYGSGDKCLMYSSVDGISWSIIKVKLKDAFHKLNTII